jgi:hypothetical protein
MAYRMAFDAEANFERVIKIINRISAIFQPAHWRWFSLTAEVFTFILEAM